MSICTKNLLPVSDQLKNFSSQNANNKNPYALRIAEKLEGIKNRMVSSSINSYRPKPHFNYPGEVHEQKQ